MSFFVWPVKVEKYWKSKYPAQFFLADLKCLMSFFDLFGT